LCVILHHFWTYLLLHYHFPLAGSSDGAVRVITARGNMTHQYCDEGWVEARSEARSEATSGRLLDIVVCSTREERVVTQFDAAAVATLLVQSYLPEERLGLLFFLRCGILTHGLRGGDERCMGGRLLVMALSRQYTV